MYKAALIQSIAIILAVIVINLSKKGKEMLAVKTECPIQVYYLAVIINVISIVYANNFQGILSGKINGTLFGYLSMFLSMDVLFIVYLYCSNKNINTIWICSLYLVIKLLYTSRSAPLLIIIYLLCSLAFDNKKIKKNLFASILILTLIAPIVFFFATNLRGITNSNESIFSLGDSIVSRLSAPELGGLYLYQYDNNIYNKELFENKYSLANQVKLTINSIVPGDLFKSDIDPNQYVRAIFMGYNEESCRENYTSINLTLPIYLVIKYSLVLGLIICIAIIYILFRICSRYHNNLAFIIIGISVLYDLLYYFDWVMILRRVLTIFLTILVVNCISKYKRKYKFVYGNIVFKWRSIKCQKKC